MDVTTAACSLHREFNVKCLYLVPETDYLQEGSSPRRRRALLPGQEAWLMALLPPTNRRSQVGTSWSGCDRANRFIELVLTDSSPERLAESAVTCDALCCLFLGRCGVPSTAATRRGKKASM